MVKPRSTWWITFVVCAFLVSLVAACGDNLGAPADAGVDAVADAPPVTPPTLIGITFPVQPRLAAGTTLEIVVTAHSSDGSSTDVTSQVTWSTQNPVVATVAGGTITGLTRGDTTITAMYDGRYASTLVTVTAATLALQSIAITPDTPTLAIGADLALVATATYTDGSTAPITVAWTSSNPVAATIGATDGVVAALAAGTTTITADLGGGITDTTTVTTFLAPVGAWIAEPGFPAGTLPCIDGIKFAMASDVAYVCTATTGLVRGPITGTAIAWATATTVTDNPNGLAIAAHSMAPTAMMYLAAPTIGLANWYRSGDAAATFNSVQTLADSAGNPRVLYAGRFQQMIGNLIGSWDPGTAGIAQAVVLTGTTAQTVRVVATATGTVRAIAGSAANNLYVAVLGETPTGDPATGGVFRSTNSAATWVAQDTGFAETDKPLASTLVIDPTNPLILYAGLRGGARVYKTIDAGATWTASAVGIPARAKVLQLLVSPTTVTTLFAATSLGLYTSADAGATWTLAGFQGRAVRGVAQSGADASLILVGIDDAVGLYRRL